MPIKEVNGVKLYYDEYGSGDRHLLCAMQSHSRIKSWTIDLAAQGFHVVNVTLRGYGQSTHLEKGEDLGDEWYETWADDVCALADALGIDKFFYTGWSHGAGVGWLICIRHPERVRGFFAIAGGPHTKDGQETGASRMETIRAAENEELWERRSRGLAAWAFPPLFEDADPEEKALRHALYQESYQSWKNMAYEERIINPRKPFPKEKTEEELILRLREVKAPTLMIGGMEDDICLPANIIRSCRAVEKSKMIIYEGSGHGVPREHQSEIVSDILQFCADRKLF